MGSFNVPLRFSLVPFFLRCICYIVRIREGPLFAFFSGWTGLHVHCTMYFVLKIASQQYAEISSVISQILSSLILYIDRQQKSCCYINLHFLEYSRIKLTFAGTFNYLWGKTVQIAMDVGNFRKLMSTRFYFEVDI